MLYYLDTNIVIPLVGDQERFSSELERATRNGVFG